MQYAAVFNFPKVSAQFVEDFLPLGIAELLLEFFQSEVDDVVMMDLVRTLAHVGAEVKLDVEGQATQRSILDALEARYPILRGTIRDHLTQQRRPFVRFFACEQDLSHELPDALLPDVVASGAEPFFVVGAIAGG